MSASPESGGRRALALATLGICVEHVDTTLPTALPPAQALAFVEAQLEEVDLLLEELNALREAAEEALQAHVAFRAEHPLPILSVDRQLQVVAMNGAAERLFGLDSEEPVPGAILRRSLARDAAVRLLERLHQVGPGSPVDAGTVRLAPEGGEPQRVRVFLQARPIDGDGPFEAVLVPETAPNTDTVLVGLTLEALGDAVCVTSPSGEFIFSNPAFAAFVSRSRTELAGLTWLDLLPLPEAVQHVARERQVLETGLRLAQREHRDGSDDQPGREFAVVKAPLYDAQGCLIGVMTHARDVTEEAAGAAARRLSELVFQHSSDAIAVTDARLGLSRFNPAFERLVGFTAEQLIGNRLDRLGTPGDIRQRRELRSDLENRGFWAGELPLRTADGRDLVVWCSVARLVDEAGTPIGYVAVHTDLTELRAVHAENEKLAQYDTLTGLPNRATLIRALEQAVSAARVRKERFSVAFVDLDHFKTINDTLGHSTGDQLLRLAAAKLRAQFRPRDTVARIGGDEFVVLMPTVDARAAQRILGRVREQFQTPLDLGAQTGYRCSLSVGIASYPEHGETAEELFRLADTAMYAAKSEGRNGVRTYERSMGEAISRAFDIRNAVLDAIDREELELYFQPLFNLEHRFVAGAEVLVRWNRPGHGLVPPNEFLPAMELAGMMTDLDRWVFRNAIGSAARWLGEGLLPAGWILSINQTSISINQADWVDQLHAAIERVDLATPRNDHQAVRLQLELTEDHLAEPVTSVLASLHRLREMGLSLAIDDFGTGYSNLSYLHTLPISSLKIDRSFVRNLDNETGVDVVIEAMILMGQKLGFDIVAEGVETEAQALRLLELGCRLGQGYLVAPPLPADLFRDRFLVPAVAAL